MTEPRRVDVNGGDFMMLNPATMLVREYESAFALAGKIGTPPTADGIVYLMTMTGRINNTDRNESWSFVMSPQDTWNLLSTMLEQFEHFAGLKDLRTGQPGPNANKFKAAKRRRKGK